MPWYPPSAACSSNTVNYFTDWIFVAVVGCIFHRQSSPVFKKKYSIKSVFARINDFYFQIQYSALKSNII
jgi:hypothetical protein